MRPRGLTLAEVLVAGALLTVTAALVALVLRPGLQAWTRGQARAEVQQSVLVASRWLEADVQRAAPRSFHLDQGRLSMATPGPEPAYDASGSLLWSQRVMYWLDQQGRLRRQTEDLPATPEEPEPRGLLPSPQARVVARDLEVFTCTLEEGLVRYHLEAARGVHRSALEGACRSFFPGN